MDTNIQTTAGRVKQKPGDCAGIQGRDGGAMDQVVVRVTRFRSVLRYLLDRVEPPWSVYVWWGGRVNIYIPIQSFCTFTVKVGRRWP